MNIEDILQTGGSGRTGIWEAAINRFFASNPLKKIIGYGHGSFQRIVNYEGDFGRASQSHNMFVNEIIEGGIVGLVLLLLCFYSQLKETKKHRNYFGFLLLIGFMMEGISLDAQVFRGFATTMILPIMFMNFDQSNGESAAAGLISG